MEARIGRGSVASADPAGNRMQREFPGGVYPPHSAAVIDKYRHPFIFCGLATAIPWAFWFAAAYLSHLTPASRTLAVSVSVLGVVGLCAPALIAFAMMWPDPDLRRDLKRRLFDLRAVRPFYLLLTFFLMPASILAAQLMSLLFGYSADQFSLSGKTSFTGGILPGWFFLFLAPLVEELAWHSYGTDCLRQRMNLLAASLLFAVYWAIWHMPLSFIKDYYHSNLAEARASFTASILRLASSRSSS